MLYNTDELNSTTMKPKILLFDIETAPAKGWFWGVWETNVIEVEEHGYMLSWSAKWLDEKRVITRTLADYRGHKANSSNDKKLVQELAELIDTADLVIAHNGDRFDILTTNTRMLVNGLKPLSPAKTVDTLKVARNKFKFMSNKLDDLANILGIGRKLPHTGKNLWFGCMNNDPKSWAIMRKYNEQDVRLLEAVYLKMLPWITKHPVLSHEHGLKCSNPTCGSTHLQKRGFQRTETTLKQRYQCQSCGKWTVGRENLLRKKK